MIGVIKRVLKLADKFAGKIKIAFVFGFFEGIFNNMPIFAILYILTKIVNLFLIPDHTSDSGN